MLAALLGALSQFHAVPAQAQVPPGLSRNVQAASSYSYSGNSLILTWQAPASWNGTPLSYEIDWYKGATAPAEDSADWQPIRPTGGGTVVSHTATSYSFPSDRELGRNPPVRVAYGAKYHFRIRAVRVNPNDVNDPFVGNWVIVSATFTHSHGPAPGKPVPTEVTAAAGARTLSFSIPCVTPGSGHVTNYQVGVKKSDGSDSEVFSTHEFTLAEYNANRSCPTTTVKLTGLTPGTAYTFRARARNIFGRRGEWSDGVEATTPQMFLGGGSNDLDRTEALTASFEQVPAAHDGKGTFDLLVRLSETIGNFSKSPRASSFEVTQGSVVMVEQADAGLWRVRVRPSSWSKVTVTLAGGRDCDTKGAVCTRDIRALSNTVTATVVGPTRIQVKGAQAAADPGNTGRTPTDTPPPNTGGTPPGGPPAGGGDGGGAPNTGGTSTGGGGGGLPPSGSSDEPPPEDDELSTLCSQEDRETLGNFYETTGGENWDENENWNSPEPPQEWFGVKTDEDGNVVSLRLSHNALSGEVPARELLCLSELKELALWGNDDLSGEVPEDLVLRVERAVLRDIAEMLNINPEWFENYGDPYNFEDWQEGVTTDDDGRVTELDLIGEGVEIPESVSELKRLREIMITSSGGGGCALNPKDNSSAFSLFLLTLAVFAVVRRKRAR